MATNKIRDPTRERLYNAVAYYRRKKADGKEWMPKRHSVIAIFCKEHGLDVKCVIEGTQSISKAEPIVIADTTRIEELVLFYRKQWLVFQSKPWVPGEDSELHNWCQARGIDPVSLIETTKSVTELLT